MHQGNGFILAETGGAEEITLTINQIPTHSHPVLATTQAADERNPANKVLAQALSQIYINDVPGVNLNPNTISATGGSQPHTNFQPYLCVDFIISLFGIFPTPT